MFLGTMSPLKCFDYSVTIMVHFAYGITPLYNELKQLFSTVETSTELSTIVSAKDRKKDCIVLSVASMKNWISYMTPFV